VLRCLRLGALGPFQDSSAGFLGRLACLPLSLVVAQIDDSGKRRPCPGGAARWLHGGWARSHSGLLTSRGRAGPGGTACSTGWAGPKATQLHSFCCCPSWTTAASQAGGDSATGARAAKPSRGWQAASTGAGHGLSALGLSARHFWSRILEARSCPRVLAGEAGGVDGGATPIAAAVGALDAAGLVDDVTSSPSMKWERARAMRSPWPCSRSPTLGSGRNLANTLQRRPGPKTQIVTLSCC
jgi:hypothetical protein